MTNVKLPRRQFLHLAAGSIALPALSRIARAQNYPTRPITIVMPCAAGGATDVIARNVGERMKAYLGQPVIIENVTGASGSISVGRVARSAPDGYTLSLGNSCAATAEAPQWRHRQRGGIRGPSGLRQHGTTDALFA